MVFSKHSPLLLHPIRLKNQFLKLNVLDMFKKRMESSLQKLKQMSSKLSDGKSIGDGLMIDLIITYYGSAIRQNKTCLSDMRKAVWAVHFHLCSSDEEPLPSFYPVDLNS
ncbi:hypothetical protein TNCV_1071461 [Trichonephila clavipes]|nr:hypothetical protein TNCV_1071461 [Trichonephila clavipes]